MEAEIPPCEYCGDAATVIIPWCRGVTTLRGIQKICYNCGRVTFFSKDSIEYAQHASELRRKRLGAQ
jgi:hypothetical protein